MMRISNTDVALVACSSETRAWTTRACSDTCSPPPLRCDLPTLSCDLPTLSCDLPTLSRDLPALCRVLSYAAHSLYAARH
eukprot:1381955-Rhodomonas_salina.1